MCWQIKELKSRLVQEENNNNTESDVSVKEEMLTTTLCETAIPGSDTKELSYECFNKSDEVGGGSSVFHVDFKDGSSDSDSSAILNEENNNHSPNNNAAISSCGVLQSHGLLLSPSSSSMNNCFQFQKQYQTTTTQYVKMEEHNFLSADEACNFFSDEQAPTLQWYCSEEWS